MAFQEAWVCVHHEEIQQVTWTFISLHAQDSLAFYEDPVPQSGEHGFNPMFFYICSKSHCLRKYRSLGCHIHYVVIFTDESLIVYGFCVIQEVWAEE